MDARDLYAYATALRWRVLDALRSVPPELLQRDMGTNHRSIQGTLIHIMAVEQSWVYEDLEGHQPLSWEEFRDRYLNGQESLESTIEGWRRVSAETLRTLQGEPHLQRAIPLTGFDPDERAVSVEQVILHIATEELIHMGEVLAMTRQLDIDLPSYFLMSIMDHRDEPWRQLSMGSGDTGVPV